MEFEIKETVPNSGFTESIKAEYSTIPVFDADVLSYHDFFENFISKNQPCVIRNVTKNWEAARDWVSNDKPDVDFLKEKYGHTKVIIYNCSDKYFNSQKSEYSTLSEYTKYWKNKESNDTLYYLKDWHLKLQCKNDIFYEVPIYFAADWLNEYFTQCLDDDYRFVYMGPKGTWTPFHADVFTSYSWSVNVCGKKRWLFFPPGEENYLKDNLNNLPYDVSEVSHSRKHFAVIQNSGEAIFVPSGWYHQVWNLEDTISINHNWVNGCNIFTMWKSLRENLENTKKEIDDCKDMDDFEKHCQIMLKALFGINYKMFYQFLNFIAESRISMLTNKSERVLFHNHIIGTNHICFDLKRIQEVLEDFLICDEVYKTEYYLKGTYLLDEIVQILKNTHMKT